MTVKHDLFFCQYYSHIPYLLEYYMGPAVRLAFTDRHMPTLRHEEEYCE